MKTERSATDEDRGTENVLDHTGLEIVKNDWGYNDLGV